MPATTTGRGARRPKVWTIEAVRNLGATTDVETAGAILGIGRSKSYELAKSGAFPVRLLRIGRRYLVPIPSILVAIGVTDSSTAVTSTLGHHVHEIAA